MCAVGGVGGYLLLQIMKEVTKPLKGRGVRSDPEEVHTLQFERSPLVLQSIPAK